MVKKEVQKNSKKKKKDKHPIFSARRTFSEKAADKFTTWVGSWTFIIVSVILIVFWMILNTSWLLFGDIWDPKPFIMLNLILSIIAALQAPIILMSQNRESQRDRIRAEYDYAVNRKSAREISTIKKQLDRIERKFVPKRK